MDEVLVVVSAFAFCSALIVLNTPPQTPPCTNRDALLAHHECVMLASTPHTPQRNAPAHADPDLRLGDSLATSPQKDPRLSLLVKPDVGLAPVDVRVRVQVDRDDRNRGLLVGCEGETYARSSWVQLDGAEAPRTHTFFWQKLPGGNYVFFAQLYNSSGVWKTVTVERSYISLF